MTEITETEKNDVNGLIVVEQLPVIREKLASLSAGIKEKVNFALTLDCSEETVKEIKALRAELNRDKAEIEARRKAVKNAIMTPYERFETVYKEYVTNIYDTADRELKKRIDAVEDGIKREKEEKIKEYYYELCERERIDFVPFERTGIKITLSASMKSLRDAADAFIGKILDDLKLINTINDREEILVDYKKSLNASEAIRTAVERRKAIDAEKEKAAAERKEAPEEAKEEREALKAPAVRDFEDGEEKAQTANIVLRMSAPEEILLDAAGAVKKLLIDRGFKFDFEKGEFIHE